MAMVRYPLPITAAMLLPANANITKPRYDANWTSDWHGAQFGNEEDQAEATQAIANSCFGARSNRPDPSRSWRWPGWPRPDPLRCRTARVPVGGPVDVIARLGDVGVGRQQHRGGDGSGYLTIAMSAILCSARRGRQRFVGLRNGSVVAALVDALRPRDFFMYRRWVAGRIGVRGPMPCSWMVSIGSGSTSGGSAGPTPGTSEAVSFSCSVRSYRRRKPDLRCCRHAVRSDPEPGSC